VFSQTDAGHYYAVNNSDNIYCINKDYNGDNYVVEIGYGSSYQIHIYNVSAWENNSAQQNIDLTLDVVKQALFVNYNKVAYTSSSSIRYKHDVKDIEDTELDPNRLYELKVRQGVYNDGVPLQYWDLKNKTIPMLIAEEVAEIYPSAVILNDDQQIESWDERRIIPPMLKLIQDQKSQIDTQQAEIDELKQRLAALEEMIGGLVNANS
jgi:hypothetical protein